MVWTVMALPSTGIYHPLVGAMTEVLLQNVIFNRALQALSFIVVSCVLFVKFLALQASEDPYFRYHQIHERPEAAD